MVAISFIIYNSFCVYINILHRIKSANLYFVSADEVTYQTGPLPHLERWDGTHCMLKHPETR